MTEKKETLKFSILVPVYQVENYIDACIQSVLDQTYANWELILVDDGTKDNSGIICDRYAEKYPHIHVYHKENRGLMHTRRYGIARATGDYYIFLDSDDMLKPYALQTIYDTIQKHHCDCVIYGYERFLNGRIIEVSPQEEEICLTEKRAIYKKCCFGGCGYLWRKAVRADVFRGGIDYSPYYHIQLQEDELQSLEILQKSEKICFVDDKLYLYRVNPSSITGALKEKDAKDVFEVRTMCLDFFAKEAVFSQEDFEKCGAEYLRECVNLILQLAMQERGLQKKITELKERKQEELYRQIVENKIYDVKQLKFRGRVLVTLYLRGWYKMTLAVGKVYYSYMAWNKKRKSIMERKLK